MKIKTCVIAYHAIVIGIVLATFLQIKHMTYQAIDITELNESYQEVMEVMNTYRDQEVLRNEEIWTELETLYSCDLIFMEDNDYMQQLYAAYANGDLVMDYINQDMTQGKIIFHRNNDSFVATKQKMMKMVLLFFAIGTTLVDLMLILIYHRILQPFHKLKSFARNVALGDLDMPLDRNRYNYFGAFTESFDLMREELKIAREGEATANRSKKELVASLSHDIKTPVSTIKALCEILEIKVEDQMLVRKIQTIEQKADVIDQLISNMFHATLSELEVLKIHPSPQPSTLLGTMIEEMNHYNKIYVENQIPSCLILCDPLRMAQVIDNIISNSYKYAGTNIYITFWENKTEVFMKVRDEGKQLEELDLALVCEKFYRGSSAKGKNGSGLGLFLAKTFMEGMGGSLQCEQENGFSVILSLKKDGKKMQIEQKQSQ